MKSIETLFFIFIFLKQFYIFGSGSLQPADIIFLITFCIYLYKKRGFSIREIDKKLIVFFAFVYFINLTYYIFYLEKGFLISTFHYLFIILVIILFRELSIKEFVVNKVFLSNLGKILKLVLITQLVIFFTGKGRYFGKVRYMGTFNDPNQMAFNSYITFMLIFLIYNLLRKKLNIIYYIITIFLIIQTSSTGMLLGIISFSVLYMIFKTYRSIKYKKIKVLKVFIVVICSVIFCFLIKILNSDNINKPNTIFDQVEYAISKISGDDKKIIIFDRLEEKLFKVSENNQGSNILEDRGIDKMYIYPIYNLFGAGQGAYNRFDRSSLQNEIHSTLPSILFCYGIIPLIIVIRWGLNNLRRIPLEISAIYISLIIESFTLINQRQPLFWIIFMVGYLYKFEYKS